MLGRQTSCCGFSPPINAVEEFFAKLTTRRLKRGVFVSVVDLQAAINRFVAEHNTKQLWRRSPHHQRASVSPAVDVSSHSIMILELAVHVPQN